MALTLEQRTEALSALQELLDELQLFADIRRDFLTLYGRTYTPNRFYEYCKDNNYPLDLGRVRPRHARAICVVLLDLLGTV